MELHAPAAYVAHRIGVQTRREDMGGLECAVLVRSRDRSFARALFHFRMAAQICMLACYMHELLFSHGFCRDRVGTV